MEESGLGVKSMDPTVSEYIRRRIEIENLDGNDETLCSAIAKGEVFGACLRINQLAGDVDEFGHLTDKGKQLNADARVRLGL